jgi:hypothetical protein
MQIETYLTDNPRCGMVLIDGMLDLLTSFNDIAESTRLIKIFNDGQSNSILLYRRYFIEVKLPVQL